MDKVTTLEVELSFLLGQLGTATPANERVMLNAYLQDLALRTEIARAEATIASESLS